MHNGPLLWRGLCVGEAGVTAEAEEGAQRRRPHAFLLPPRSGGRLGGGRPPVASWLPLPPPRPSPASGGGSEAAAMSAALLLPPRSGGRLGGGRPPVASWLSVPPPRPSPASGGGSEAAADVGSSAPPSAQRGEAGRGAPSGHIAVKTDTKNPAHGGVSSWPSLDTGRMLVPRRGLEPPRFYPLVPETSASTNSATWAGGRVCCGAAASKSTLLHRPDTRHV